MAEIEEAFRYWFVIFHKSMPDITLVDIFKAGIDYGHKNPETSRSFPDVVAGMQVCSEALGWTAVARVETFDANLVAYVWDVVSMKFVRREDIYAVKDQFGTIIWENK